MNYELITGILVYFIIMGLISYIFYLKSQQIKKQAETDRKNLQSEINAVMDLINNANEHKKKIKANSDMLKKQIDYFNQQTKRML